MQSYALVVFTGVCIGAYLMGSVSTAVLVCRASGLPDPRTEGSRNPGTTNVLRLAGKPAAAATLLGDALKGVLAVVAASAAGLPPSLAGWGGLCAFLGHILPLYFGFHGGKGVATALGVLAALAWPLALANAAVWLAVFAVSRISSLAALISWGLTLVAAWLWAPDISASLSVITLILIARHKANIEALIKGTERAFPSRSD